MENVMKIIIAVVTSLVTLVTLFVKWDQVVQAAQQMGWSASPIAGFVASRRFDAEKKHARKKGVLGPSYLLEVILAIALVAIGVAVYFAITGPAPAAASNTAFNLIDAVARGIFG